MPPPQSLRDQQRELTRRRIVDAAHDAFTAGGVAATTLDQIARRAGISRATLYLHFPNKEAILLELLERNLRSVRSIFGSLADAAHDGRAAVIQWLENYVALLRRHRGDLRLFSVAVANDPQVTVLVREHRALIANRIVRRDSTARAAEDMTARQRTRFLILIARIDQVASALSEETCDFDRPTALDIVASEILSTLGRAGPADA